MKNFKEKTIYQIYPKSFLDSNGDGVGDLQGIIQKIPYLANLGIEMIWLSPIFESPQKDNGYDISNYYQIDPRFGTMEDFEQLVEVAKTYQIELMLDMVLNHTSIEHEWFQKALEGNPFYQDFYFIRPAKSNGELPTNWESKFGGPAWEKFGDTDKYYLHLYDVSQADLNWRNPEVRKELFKIVEFWLEKGVTGFRFDVINVIGKETELVDAVFQQDEKRLYTDRPIVHEYLKEMNQATFGNDPRSVTVGEMSSTSIENCLLYTQPDRQELNMVFNFHHLKVDYTEGDKWTCGKMDFEQLKAILHSWGEKMSAGNGWNALFWNNHDQPRIVSRFIDDLTHRVEGAQMLAASIHLNRGTPFVYQGEEIGMLNPVYDGIEDYQDIESLNHYQILLEQGVSKEGALQVLQEKSRDNSRTPIPWNDGKGGGFTTGKPWIKLNSDTQAINVSRELKEGRIFPFYQQLIQLRKELPIIAYGTYHPFQPEHPNVYAFERIYNGKRMLVLNHFFAGSTEIVIPEKYLSGEVVVSNYHRSKETLQEKLSLKPYETLAILIDQAQ